MKPTSPAKVGAARGGIYAALVALAIALVAITPVEAEAFGPAAPFLVFAGRYLEALLLDNRQPPQAGPLGGAPAAGGGA